MAIWYIVFPFGYVAPRKIWQPWFNSVGKFAKVLSIGERLSKRFFSQKIGKDASRIEIIVTDLG
jgi:hypothetical protein